MPTVEQENRKIDHIDLAIAAQIKSVEVDHRFFYEPLLSAHPTNDTDISTTFLGKKLSAPLWISSMTGGVGPARHINQNLARVAFEFGLGMGLGSCRVLLDPDLEKTYFNDFNLRPIMGDELPLFANLGIAQVEELLRDKKHQKIIDLVSSLSADGLIVHINPLQEWFQPEGDRLKFSPIETLARLCDLIDTTKCKIIVKEVGQGMGPASLQALLNFPLAGIELAAIGGTNFTKLEQLRDKSHIAGMEAFAKVGHSASEMVQFLNKLSNSHPEYRQKQIIISGGIETILDGYFLRENLEFNSVIGQAKNYLAHAENYEDLRAFTEGQIKALKIAKSFLVAKKLNEDSL